MNRPNVSLHHSFIPNRIATKKLSLFGFPAVPTHYSAHTLEICNQSKHTQKKRFSVFVAVLQLVCYCAKHFEMSFR